MKTVRILIVDIDNCILNPSDMELRRNHFLSPVLLDVLTRKMLSAENYAGFYVCTHRSYKTSEANIRAKLSPLEYCRDPLINNNKRREAEEFDPTDLFVPNIIRNFIEAIVTGCARAGSFESKHESAKPPISFPCFGVSTPDDIKHNCGYAYKNILCPYETAVTWTQSNTKGKKTIYIGDDAYEIENGGIEFDFESNKRRIYDNNTVDAYDPDTKNTQLLQIISDAQKIFRNCRLEFDHIDDNPEILANALQGLPLYKDQLKDVRFNVYHHDAFDNSEVMWMGTPLGTMADTDYTEAEDNVPIPEPVLYEEEEEEEVKNDASSRPSEEPVIVRNESGVSFCAKLAASLSGCQTYFSQCCAKVSSISIFKSRPKPNPNLALELDYENKDGKAPGTPSN